MAGGQLFEDLTEGLLVTIRRVHQVFGVEHRLLEIDLFRFEVLRLGDEDGELHFLHGFHSLQQLLPPVLQRIDMSVEGVSNLVLRGGGVQHDSIDDPLNCVARFVALPLQQLTLMRQLSDGHPNVADRLNTMLRRVLWHTNRTQRCRRLRTVLAEADDR